VKPANSETLINLLGKIRALADRGSPGERDVAQRKLTELLDRYNLTIEDLLDETTSPCRVPCRTALEEKILLDLYFHLTAVRRCECAYRRRGQRAIYFELTKAQATELSAYVHTYLPAWRRELHELQKAAHTAFIHVHALFPAKNDPRQAVPLSREELRRILGIMSGITPVASPRLQLEAQD
jgi:hypothetical protein